MEKQTKHKNKILRFLPKALSFQNPPFSPSRDKDAAVFRPVGGRGFSGPIVSIIPREARSRRTMSEVVDTPQEPSSPKVSCLGQIKQRHKKKKQEVDARRSRPPLKAETAKKAERMSKGGVVGSAGAKAPALGQMRRFASSRSSLSNFDWTAQVAPEDLDQRNCRSDKERGEEEEEEGEEEVGIPFSAPIAAGGGEMRLKPKNEINLWKRRTMVPPRPLALRPSADS